MAFTLNLYILRTPTGILKIVEFVLILIVLLLARFGQDGYPKPFGTVNDDFLGIGTTVGYAIIVPAILVTYLLGSNLSILELFINFLGGVLFILVGAVTISHYQYYNTAQRSGGYAMGSLAIITGLVFLIDFVFAVKNTKFSVVQTRVMA